MLEINCDMGEGLASDASIMPYISSCSIACGGHAGDDESMKRTVDLALKHGVNIGAHPSYVDRESFGRRALVVEHDRLREQLLEQLERLRLIVHQQGGILVHIKPHGALYNQASVAPGLAQLVVDVCLQFDKQVTLLGLSQSLLSQCAAKQQLCFRHEVFVDRHYINNGTLVPRSEHNAVLDDVDMITSRALRMAKWQKLTTVDGGELLLNCESFCIHGDHPKALAIAASVHRAFMQEQLLTNL